MYPPETSLIPVAVALARFVAENGLSGHFPYWYLGVPYQYLTGPIIPLLQVFLHRALPASSLFELTYILLFLSFLASIFGWGILVKKISGKRFIGVVVGVLLLVLPWKFLSTLALSEASGVVARNLLPFVLVAFWQFFRRRSRKRAVYAVLALSVLLLINTTVFTIFLVGITGLILASSFKKGKFRGITSKVKKTLVLVLLSFLLATLWYTPGYWITVLTNPSIGGASGVKVFLRIFDLLRASIPLFLAIGAVYFSGKIRDKLTIFSLTWIFTFLFLTVFRFIGDPDFWQDWTSWLSELEIGLAFLASSVIVDLRLKILERKIPKAYYITLLALFPPFYLTWRIHLALGRPKLISTDIPQGIQSLEKLNDIVNKDNEGVPREAAEQRSRVFLSGSTVFWANSLYDLNQVRGGVDKAATHPYWDHAAFQLREGTSSELASAWLKALGVSYVLVHGPASPEKYHDFRSIEKWQEVGEVVWTENGDAIVQVPTSLAWVVDLVKLKKVKPPEGGADSAALNKYLSAKKRDALFKKTDNNSIVIETGKLSESEGIVIAVSKNAGWKTEDGKLSKDPLGNILLTPNDYTLTTYTLWYR